MADDKKLNPFDEGVTYEKLQASFPKDVVLSKYYKDILTEEEITWLESELSIFNNNKKTKKNDGN